MRRLARRARVLLLTTPSQRRAHRVAARRLDAARPGWHDELDLRTLCMSSGTRCVLGQLYGDYDHGLTALYGSRRHVLMSIGPGARAFGGAFPRVLWDAEVRDRRDRRERAAVVALHVLLATVRDDREACCSVDHDAFEPVGTSS